MPLVTVAHPERVTSWQIAAGIAGFFAALREFVIHEQAAADGYTRGRSEALDEVFWRFVSSGDVDYRRDVVS
jgi:hypothetical protein